MKEIVQKLKENIAEVRKIKALTEEDLEFVDAIADGVDDLMEEHESEIEKKDDEIEELKEDNDDEDEFQNTINAGIGTIDWNSDNLQLIDLMERLTEALKTVPPNKLLAQY